MISGMYNSGNTWVVAVCKRQGASQAWSSAEEFQKYGYVAERQTHLFKQREGVYFKYQK